jgi:PhnB protein
MQGTLKRPHAGTLLLHKQSASGPANQIGRSALVRIIRSKQETAMLGKANPIPEGFHTVTPYLIVEGAEKIIGFMREAFGAETTHEPTRRPDGKIMHATVKIGDSLVMIADASEQVKAMPAMLYLYVPNVDASYQRALKAGGTSIMEPADQFYGDRSSGVKDAAGNSWFIGTHVEDVSPAELKKRSEEMFKKQGRAA